jgi:type-F conjugative transfer system pilin assembly protein TrbC
VIASVSLADSYQEAKYDDTAKWAREVARKSTSMVWQELVAKFSRLEQIEERHNFNEAQNEELAPVARLYIFVSGSMPKALLKAYLKEASRFKGILVFKGLPNGSFKELSKLVIDLTSNNSRDPLEHLDAGAMQIDDEAFARFAVNAVPTVILAQEKKYTPDMADPQITYDKITGNVGIKYALEQFSLSGDLAQEALEQLNGDRK